MNTKETAYDKRTALPDGFELTINEKNTDNRSENTYKITIQRKIASGGSCLVYRGLLDKCVGDEQATYDVIVKEVYPKRLDEEILADYIQNNTYDGKIRLLRRYYGITARK